MRRALGFLVLVGLVMVATEWFAARPGAVSIVWQGWRIDTSFGILLLAVMAIALIAALAYRVWRSMVRAPRELGRWRRERRRRQGYVALTSGLVAVAAGDAREARRHARRADELLDEPPLTMLLAAQAAQLTGDEAEARRHFTQMLARPETEFLALRGLITQALKSGDRDEALRLARRARLLRPRTAWVESTLLELETASGNWDAARSTLGSAQRAGALPPAAAQHHAAAVALEAARTAAADGRPRDALAAAQRAWKAAPDHPAVAPALARRYLALGRRRAARRVVERAWTRTPHPELASLWEEIEPAEGPVARVKRAERLARLAPRHRESHLALARAALDAKLWGEARRHLTAAIAADGDVASSAASRLMARLEEQDGADPAASKAWLERAADAPPDPAWTCGACGATSAEWHATCPNCGAFDRIDWRLPPTGRAAGAVAVPVPAPPPAS